MSPSYTGCNTSRTALEWSPSVGPEVMPGTCSRTGLWWIQCAFGHPPAPARDPSWALGFVLHSGLLHRSQSLGLKFTLEFQPVQYSSTGAQMALSTLQPRHFAMAVTKMFPGTTLRWPAAASSKIRPATYKHWVPTDQQESEPHGKHGSLPICS